MLFVFLGPTVFYSSSNRLLQVTIHASSVVSIKWVKHQSDSELWMMQFKLGETDYICYLLITVTNYTNKQNSFDITKVIYTIPSKSIYFLQETH